MKLPRFSVIIGTWYWLKEKEVKLMYINAEAVILVGNSTSKACIQV